MKKITVGFIALLTSLNLFAAGNEAALELAFEAATKTATQGPATVEIAGQASLTVPKGFEFIPKMEADALMKAMGNSTSPELKGILLSSEGNGFYTVDHVQDGYVKDDDAKDLDPKDILDSYTEGTESTNEERVKAGFPAIEIGGWSQKPAYDAASRRLTWALLVRDKGVPAGAEDGVNYETRILGRDGYISMTWVTAALNLNAAGKADADKITAGVQYLPGKTYADFNETNGDKVAEYGLAALILGVGAKKLGLFALIIAFVAKFAKIGFLVVIGLFAVFKKFFTGKSKPETESETELETELETEEKTSVVAQDELKDTSKL
jgi:uncharacterized membrane-anchored protein